MLETLFILLLFFAILMVIFSIEYENNPFWNIIACGLSIVTFYILSLGIIELEIPYQLYNQSSGAIETGYQAVHTPINAYMSYFFMGLAIIMFIYMIAMIWDKIVNWKPKP